MGLRILPSIDENLPLKMLSNNADSTEQKAPAAVMNGVGLGWRPLSERSVSMVDANKNLLKLVRRLAIRDEVLAMRLRGRLVAPLVVPPAKKATGPA